MHTNSTSSAAGAPAAPPERSPTAAGAIGAVVLTLICGLTMPVASAFAQSSPTAPPQMMLDTIGAAAAAPAHALAAWDVVLNAPAIEQGQADDLLTLVLPEGAAVPCSVRKVTLTPTGGRMWHARTMDNPQASLVLAQVGDAFAGALWHPDLGTYEFRPTGDVDTAGQPITRVLRLDPAAEWTCANGASHGLHAGLQQHAPAADGGPQVRRVNMLPTSGSEPAAPCGCSDDGAIVDVLIAYTTEAKVAAGGLDAIESIATASVASMNEAFTNSSIPVQLRLVHLVETSYDESSHPTPPSNMRTALRVDGDGHLDELHDLRDQYAADLVSLLVNDLPGAGGAAFLAMGSPEMGFSVLEWDIALGPLVFAHELGHNFGCQHDYPSEDLIPDHYYAFGHKMTDSGGTLHRTIMAYAPGQLLPNFSNPEVIVFGFPTGRPLTSGSPRHNALVINQTAQSIANLRESGEGIADCNGNGISDCDDLAGGRSLDENANGLPDECEIRLYVDADAPDGGDGLSWATACNSLSGATGMPRYQCQYITEVWVAEGTYRPTGPQDSRRDSYHVGPRMRLLGGFAGTETAADQRDPAAHPTILTGDRLDNDLPNFINRSDNSYSVVRVFGSIGGSVIDGFTIEGGDVQQPPGNAVGLGAGLFAQGAPLINRSNIRDNRGQFGTLFLQGGRMATISNSLITTNNQSVGGGGGVAAYDGGRAGIINCTIAHNSAGIGGAIIASHDGAVMVANSILHDNSASTAPELAVADVGYGGFPSSVTVTFSDVTGGSAAAFTDSTGTLNWGLGNIDADPMFADSSSGDYTIIAGSPAIDAAENAAVPAGLTTDLASHPRFVDDPDTPDSGHGTPPVVDMGSYEHQVDLPGDLDGDGSVGTADLLQLLSAWGACADCPEDLDNDDAVGVSDLLMLIGAWS